VDICTSCFEARHDACSAQTIIGYFSRRDGGEYSAAAHAAAASHACVRRRAARPACDQRAAVAPPCPSCAGYLNDLHVYDPAAGAWTDLSAALSGTPPSPMGRHGFESAGGKLYVHGSWDDSGEGGRGGQRAWGWRSPRQGGATCWHEIGGAAGRQALGRVAGETAGGRMRGLLACVRERVDWCGDGVGRRGRVADWWPPLRRCPAEAPAGEGPGDAPRRWRGGRGWARHRA
jgi:hypothetical protein